MPKMIKAAALDYGDMQTVRFCHCGCPIEVRSDVQTLIPLMLGSPGHMMSACPFCYNSEDFPLESGPLGLIGARAMARELATRLRAEGIIGAGGTWEKEAKDAT
jgi:hypothetical protein